MAGVSETYTWSGDGIRLSAATGPQAAKTTRFLSDRGVGLPQVALERDGANKLLRRYVYGLDLLSQTTATKGPYWYHHDGLGSVTDVTSATGSSLSRGKAAGSKAQRRAKALVQSTIVWLCSRRNCAT